MFNENERFRSEHEHVILNLASFLISSLLNKAKLESMFSDVHFYFEKQKSSYNILQLFMIAFSGQ